MRLRTPLLPTQVYEDSSVLVVLRKVSVESREDGGREDVVIVVIPEAFERGDPSEPFIHVMLGTGIPKASQVRLAICV